MSKTRNSRGGHRNDEVREVKVELVRVTPTPEQLAYYRKFWSLVFARTLGGDYRDLPSEEPLASSNSKAGSEAPQVPTGDCVLDYMIKNGIPLTRENYLRLAHFDADRKLSAEEEANLPEMFQLDPVGWE
jgi:hypothetical protein